MQIFDYDRVYIAGPMTGLENENEEQFMGMEFELERQFGCQVLNPARNRTGKSREQYFRDDAVMMGMATAALFLPGWRGSLGARWEYWSARNMALKRFGHDFRPLLHPHGLFVGLTGYARCGKDTVAGLLACHRAAFATQIKADCSCMALKQFAIDTFTEDNKEKAIIRPMLVRYGQAMRKVDPDYWIKRLADCEDIYKTSRLAISDVRYPNEAAWIHLNGGLVVRLKRNNTKPANHDEEIIDELDVDLELDAGSRAWTGQHADAIYAAMSTARAPFKEDFTAP